MSTPRHDANSAAAALETMVRRAPVKSYRLAIVLSGLDGAELYHEAIQFPRGRNWNLLIYNLFRAMKTLCDHALEELRASRPFSHRKAGRGTP
jgi:hypothetical protein